MPKYKIDRSQGGQECLAASDIFLIFLIMTPLGWRLSDYQSVHKTNVIVPIAFVLTERVNQFLCDLLLLHKIDSDRSCFYTYSVREVTLTDKRKRKQH